MRKKPRQSSQSKSQEWTLTAISQNRLIPLAEAFEKFSNRPGLIAFMFLQSALEEHEFRRVCWRYEYIKTPQHAEALVKKVTTAIEQWKALQFPIGPYEQIRALIAEEESCKDEKVAKLCRQKAELLSEIHELEWEALVQSSEYHAATANIEDTAKFLRELAAMMTEQDRSKKPSNAGGRKPDPEVTDRVKILRRNGVKGRADFKHSKKMISAFGDLERSGKEIPSIGGTDWLDLWQNSDRSEELKTVLETLRKNLLRR